MSQQIRLSTNSTTSYDPLNHARIQSDSTQSLSTHQPSSSKISNKYLTLETDHFNHRQSFINLINSPQLLVTPQKSNSKLKQIVDLSKTMTIKGKKGKLYQDVCPICLTTYSPTLGILGCRHKFCFECIDLWAKTCTICPCCRQKFTQIIKKNNNNSSSIQIITVQQKQMHFRQQDYFICYICGQGDNQHVLLICDMCDFYCCHIFCDPALNNTIPEGSWFCRNCYPNIIAQSNNKSEISSTTQNQQQQQKQQKQSQQQKQQPSSNQQTQQKQQQSSQSSQLLKQNNPIATRTRSMTHLSGVQILRRIRRRI